jgi:hypothetical protein
MALQQAYSVFLGTPENLAMAKPERDYKPMRAKARRVSRDESGTITSTPNPICHATETLTGRTSTTQRVARLIDAGQIIAAAEGQPEIRANWLRFAYNPYLDINELERNRARADLIPLLWGLWAFSRKTRQPDLSNAVRLVRLLDLVMVECARQFRTDGPGMPQPRPTEWAQKIGFQSADAANWGRSWAPHVDDLYRVVDMLDRVALQPVVDELRRREAANADAVR